MCLEHLYEIPTVIEDLKKVEEKLSHYCEFIKKLNKGSLDSGLGILWSEDINCSQFSDKIQAFPPRIGSVKGLKINPSIDSVKIEFEVSNVKPDFENKYTQGHALAIPIKKIALLKTDYLIVSLSDQNCCWLFKFPEA